MVKTPCFDPWSGNEDPACWAAQPKKKKLLSQRELKNKTELNLRYTSKRNPEKENLFLFLKRARGSILFTYF